jgi:hypothetical protein
VVHVVSSSTPLVFLTSMSEKCQSTSSNAVQVKNQQKIIGVEEKLYVINQLRKVNELLTCTIMLRRAHGVVCTSHDNADRFKERTSVCVCYRNEPYQNSGCESLTFLLH